MKTFEDQIILCWLVEGNLDGTSTRISSADFRRGPSNLDSWLGGGILSIKQTRVDGLWAPWSDML